MTTHNTFGASAPPGTYSHFSDGGGSLYVANAFYTTSGTWYVTKARLWVPTGSLPWTSGEEPVTMYAWLAAYPTATAPTWASPSASATFSTALVAGWNEVTFPTPLAFKTALDGTTPQKVWVGYKTGNGNGYVHSTASASPVQASDGSALYLAEYDAGTNIRGANSAAGAVTTPLYGIDLVIDDAPANVATLSASLPKLTGSIAGDTKITGTVSASIPKLTGSISGSVGSAVTGTLSASIPKLTSSISGTTTFTGSVSAAIPKLTASISGTTTFTGTLSASIPKLTGSIGESVSWLSVAAENALTSGVLGPEYWFDYGNVEAIPGFARSSYYEPGDTLQLSVSYASAYTVQVWRLGWYGSNGGRKVADFTGGTTHSASGQPAASTIASSNGAVTCSAWSVTDQWAIPSDATPGMYWVLLRNSGGTQFAGIPFVVSDAASPRPIVVVTSDSTWHAAYNGYGGNNVYGAANGIGTITDRAYCSTYDKPVITRQYVPQTNFMNGEIGVLRFLERFGFNIAYTTNEQITNDPTILDGRSMIVFVGHNEYTSKTVRDKTAERLAAGVRVVNLAGNDFFWKVRFGSSTFPTTDATTGRVMWVKKDTMPGPSTHTAGVPFTSQADWTGTWQDTRWTGYASGDGGSKTLLGDRFVANGIRDDEVKVPVSMKSLPIWRDCDGVQALTTGQTFAFGTGTAGMEWDMPDGTLPQVSLSASVVDLTDNYSDINGQDYTTDGTATHAFQLVANGSGRIFNANTTQWGWALDDLHDRGGSVATDEARQATLNVLYDLGATGVGASITGAGLVVPTPVSDLDAAYGLVVANTGTLSAALPKLTGSISGDTKITGTLAPSLPVVTSSISGQVGSTITGTLNASLPPTTASISGTVSINGTLSANLPSITGSIPGTVTGPVTGAISASLPVITGSLPGGLVSVGTLTASLPVITASITGQGIVVGTLNALLPKLRGRVPDNSIPLLPTEGVHLSLDLGPRRRIDLNIGSGSE